MQIIPVIDLKDGLVVYAVGGDRSHYQPIHCHSKLITHSEITQVIAGFLKLYPFRLFYIADLNAITGSGDHNKLIASLLVQHLDITFWIDNGSKLSGLEIPRTANYKTVIGSESQLAPPDSSGKVNHQDFILSLDYKQQKPLGHPAWFTDSSLWPKNVIVMTLNRVGSQSGPDLDKLGELSAAHPHKNFIAAGGIRHGEDLFRLTEIGVNSALIATALHNGALSCDEIMQLRTKKYPSKLGYF